MGMMIVSAAAAWMTLATPADGHSVAPLAGATTKSEVTCDGPLAGAYLAPADTGVGVRAPLVPVSVKCTVTTDGKSQDVTVDFADSDSVVGLAADHPIILGVDSEATLSTRGEITRADGSFGPGKVGAGTITAPLPTSHMPQNLVVLASDALGNADFAVVQLMGKAKVNLKVKKNAKLAVVVAGHRTGGFSSDKKGKASIAVASPAGITDGLLEVTDKKGTATNEINLPAAKPLFALAVLGPSDAVPSGSPFFILAAGANPKGLPAAEGDFSATASAGTTIGHTALIKPGLWRIDGTAGSADGQVTVKLGQASRVVDVKIAAAPVVAAVTTPPAALAGTAPPATTPAATVTPAVTPTETKPAETAAVETKPAPAIAETKPAATTVAKAPPPAESSDDGTLHLGIGIEAGYMTNTGAISSIAPGAQVTLAYRMGSLDIGGGIDGLFTDNSQSATATAGGQSIPSTTTTTSLQMMIGPYARYRFTDLIGVFGEVGLGMSRVTQSISANSSVNSSGASTPFGFAAMAGLDLDFGLPQVFIGARYAYANASDGLSGPAGGIAGFAGIGVNLGM